MSDSFDNRGAPSSRNLRDAIRRVRTAEAERSDVVVELRDAERARLEMLADELRSVISEVPDEIDSFSFAIAGGTPPRLWIDLTAFVAMDRDRRTYRFLKDTRLGRTVILESADLGEVADVITDYVAERIIERDRAIEGEWAARRGAAAAENRRRKAAPVEAPAAMAATTATGAAALDNRVLGWVVAAFLGGLLIGMIGLLAYAWVSVPA
jgi:hypothetical protein